MPEVSVIICTRDRPASLVPTLQSVAWAQRKCGWRIELIVVDNGSGDTTRAAVAATSVEGAEIKYIQEPRKGKGYAYNSGIAAATKEILLFTDDDVRVPVDWIAGMCAPLIAGRFDAVAGAVVFPPRIAFALSRRPFVTRRNWFASSDYLDPDRPSAMIGANMAFHRRVVDSGLEFDVELGPGALGFHEESLFSLQLVAAGFRLGGAMDVAVEHHFDTSRLTREGMLDIARKMGRSRAFLEHHWLHRDARWPRLRRGMALAMAALVRTAEWAGVMGVGVVPGPLLRFTHDAAYHSEQLLQRNRAAKYPRVPAAAPGPALRQPHLLER